jgi:hypothetical protein
MVIVILVLLIVVKKASLKISQSSNILCKKKVNLNLNFCPLIFNLNQSIYTYKFLRKLGTAIVTSITAFHTVFQVDYGDDDHVFTDIQKWYRKKVDDVLLGGLPVPERTQTQVRNNEQRSNLRNDNDATTTGGITNELQSQLNTSMNVNNKSNSNNST